jgi:hypothetical protein
MVHAVSRRPPTVWDLWWTKWHWDRFFPEYFGWCRARGGRASGGQAKIVLEADRVLNTVLQADSETDPFLSAT